MLDDASQGFLGISFAETMVLAIGLALFAVSAWASIRALNSISTLIREKRPEEWVAAGPYASIYPGKDPVYRARWISFLVLGLRRLDLADDEYRTQLWRARKRLMLCAVLFAAIIATIIWFSARA